VDLEPWQEEAHREIMRLLALSGQRTAALAQYEACQHSLVEELGVEPSAETRALYEGIRDGTEPPSPPSEPPHNLPASLTPFIGREVELAQIRQRLRDPACRLLTVVGPGGIGKSRLALQAAQVQVPAFADGVWLVPLAPVASPDLLASTIMDALRLPRHGSMQPHDQLLNALRDRNLLLLLDNFEHLLEATALVMEMLREAPGLKVLVTSRERLGVREEWLLRLQGLRFPDGEVIARAREEEPADMMEAASLEDYSAVQLFVQCARRIQPHLSLAAAGSHSVARICQLVEGMPLAIELAAPWIRLMDCQDISQEIERNLDFLATSLRGVPQRHRSMRAVFDHSWELLPAEERSVLMKLSVFRGGFRREAAEAVAMRLGQSPVSLGVLSTLVDRSWVRPSPSGRYEMHELVRQYCAVLLDEVQTVVGQGEGERVRDRHSDYYATFLSEREPRLKGHGETEALESILEEMGNIHTAWEWAVERGNVEALDRGLDSLYWVGVRRGLQREMMPFLDQAVAMLREQPLVDQSVETALLLGRILCRQGHLTLLFEGIGEQTVALYEESLALLQGLAPSARQQRACAYAQALLGWFLQYSGDSARARGLLHEALAQATEVGDDWFRALVLWFLSSRSPDFSEMQGYLRQAIVLLDRLGEQWVKAWCLQYLSNLLRLTGEYEEAESLAQEALRIRRELRGPRGLGIALLALGDAEAALGKYEEASQHFRDALDIGEEYGTPFIRYRCALGMGTIAAAQGAYAEAAQLLEDAAASLHDFGNLPKSLEALVILGHATSALGQTQRAVECFHQALREAMEAAFTPEALAALVGLASLSAKTGELQRAAGLISLALQHPTTYHVDRVRAQDLLSELESELSPEVFEAATARGQARDLEATVAELLRELEAGADGRWSGPMRGMRDALFAQPRI